MNKTLYEVTVWNVTNGNIERYRSEIDDEELQELIEWYEDEPWYQIVIDREWEEDIDD